MTDPYLLLTPILMLGVLALTRFVGCDLIFVATPAQLEPPINVRAKPGNQQVTISWDPLEDADGYSVKRGTTEGGPYPTSNQVGPQETSFVDGPLPNGVEQFFVVTGRQGQEDGEESAEVSATPALGFVTFKTLGTIRNDFTGFVGMVIQTGATPLVAVGLGRIIVTGNTGAHVLKITDGTTEADVPGATVTVDLSAGGTANEFAYEIFPNPITLNANTQYYILSSETAGGDQWFDLDTTVVTQAFASDISAVFGDGIGPFTRGGGPGHTYGPVDILF